MELVLIDAYMSTKDFLSFGGSELHKMSEVELTASEQDIQIPTASTSREASQLFAGRYRLVKRLAIGGMGAVYLAEQLPLGRLVAIKVMSRLPAGHQDRREEFRKRFFLEASTCARLNHPNIVTVHDYGQIAKGKLYLVMEYLDGTTLESLIKSEEGLTPLKVCFILLQVCRALQVAHRSKFVHRDLKPSNIMLLDHQGEFEHVKVIDFGLAKAFASDENDTMELTQEGGWLGSPHYMAPEQFDGEECGPSTDIYALGVIFFRCIFGVLPFEGGNHLELMDKHINQPPDWPSSASEYPGLVMIIDRCLQKDAAARYQTVDEMITDLSTATSLISEGQEDALTRFGSTEARFLLGTSRSMPPMSRIHTTVVRQGLLPYTEYTVSQDISQALETATVIHIPSDELLVGWWAVVMTLGSVLGALVTNFVERLG